LTTYHEAFVLLVRHVPPQRPSSVFLSLQQQPVLLLLYLLLWQISWLSLLQLQPRQSLFQLLPRHVLGMADGKDL
jgi:hypothetical protein